MNRRLRVSSRYDKILAFPWQNRNDVANYDGDILGRTAREETAHV